MSQLKVNSIVDASGGSNAQLYGVASPPNSMGFRNRILNGDCRIDQRNAGASVTNVVGSVFSVDRFPCWGSVATKYTAQQSSISPTGFSKSLLITSSSAYSVGASDFFGIQHRIEGFNTADLGWGAASAQSVTLSFWVRSSLTGTFGGSFKNADNTRSYAFTYAISTANTWEQKTVTIAGDTSGTWETTNSSGIVVTFSLGVGSTFTGTAGSWASANYWSATGATSVVGTNGATFYITGVQLEAGTVASPFERRDYGRELMMCQRYYQQYGGDQAFAPVLPLAVANSTTNIRTPFVFPVEMRATPSVAFSTLEISDSSSSFAVTGITLASAEASRKAATISLNVASGLTQFRPYWTRASNSTSGNFALSSEL